MGLRVRKREKGVRGGVLMVLGWGDGFVYVVVIRVYMCVYV